MKPLTALTLLALYTLPASAQIVPLTDVQCHELAAKAMNHAQMELGYDGCNFVIATSSLLESKVIQGRCEFTLRYRESGTQVQCMSDGIPGPGYLARKPLALRKFRRACKSVGFSESLYQKNAEPTRYGTRVERTLTCQE